MRRGVFSKPAFRLLFAARAVSSLGDRLAPVALAFAVLEIGGVRELGLVLAAQSIPLVLLVLFGGVWADRVERRRVMLAADAVRGFAQAVSAWLVIAGEAQIWQLVALQAVYGAASAFFGPASTAIVAQTVASENLQQANATLQLTDSVCSFAGPALAGVLIATLSPGWGLAFDAATFALGGAFLVRLRTGVAPTPTHGSTLAQLRDGWRAFRTRAWLWVSVLFFTVWIGFAYAPLQVLGPEVSRSALGGPGAWAAISAALGVGALGGGSLALRWRPRHPLRVAFLAFMVTGPALLVLLAAHAPLGAILALALIDGASGSFFNSIWFTAQQHYVPATELSRVSSWDYLGTLAAYPLGLALAGPIALALGVSDTLYCAGALSLVLALAVLAVPAVRNFPEGAEAPVGEDKVQA